MDVVRQISLTQAVVIINVIIILARLTFPLLVSLVAVGLAKQSSNAATWSVFGRLINGSHWPILLATDSVSGKKVDKRVRVLALLSGVTAILLGVCAAITPLGLHMRLVLREASDTPFAYVKDHSPIGEATASHNDYKFNRVCGPFIIESCPGNDDGWEYITNSTGDYLLPEPGGLDYITTTVSQNITDIFTSASTSIPDTVASVFDIKYRTYLNYNNATRPGETEKHQWLDAGESRTQGQYRSYQTLILGSQYQTIEGLIVSVSENGTSGIGFRNHTLPPSTQYGHEWSEQILWLEPEVVCTDLNITYDYTIPPPDPGTPPLSGKLTDHGGLVNLPIDFPYVDLNDSQTDPQLLARSWKGAVLTNFVLKVLFNESRSNMTLGKSYSVDKYNTIGEQKPNIIAMNGMGSWNDVTGAYFPSLPGVLGGLTISGNFSNSTLEDDVLLDILVSGYGGPDPLNISTIAIAAAVLSGTSIMVDTDGQRIDDINEYRTDPGTNWTTPLYSCVAAVKASIKTVHLSMNGSQSLANLVVRKVEESDQGTQDSIVWGVEDPGRTISELSPFWGLVSTDSIGKPGISTLQRPYLYLPAGAADVDGGLEPNDAVAGLDAPFGVLQGLLSAASLTPDLSGLADYSGGTNWLLYKKWTQLSSNAGTTGKIIELIWTDIMANAVVSSKSPLSQPYNSTAAPLTSINRPTSRYIQVLAYDWRYAIPALIFAALYILLLLYSALLMCMRKLSIRTLRFMLNQTSAGRAMTTERYQASAQADLGKTKQWAEVRGDEMARVGKDAGASGYMAAPRYEYAPLGRSSGSRMETRSVAV